MFREEIPLQLDAEPERDALFVTTARTGPTYCGDNVRFRVERPRSGAA